MSEPETIVLPRSGVVLTQLVPWAYIDFRGRLGTLHLRVHQDHSGSWESQTFGGGFNVYKTRDEAVSDLDARVIALRASLLPPGSVVVDATGARERVARVLARLDEENSTRCDCDRFPDGPCIACLGDADAVLSALGLS